MVWEELVFYGLRSVVEHENGCGGLQRIAQSCVA